ncbi:cell wall teichoic acid glycosylation protein [Ligilactobacillus agilis]|uniref:Cell wall teichoic acid glycosylation protein n=1 Tax=Ligilactobacillus agilis TaxID=1601 RepID=A0A6F9Y6Q8_9LACO|nr:GtrA family protein [Ligilactobacillus agilis]GET13000.1 cell wall teichoic acid glycosylation protein [Ligilactobacillus agilis]
MIKELLLKYKAFIAYLFFGGLTTIINIVVFQVCSVNLGMYYQLANFLAWLLSVLFAFITNKLWVFESKFTTVKSFLIEMWWFFFYRIISLGFDAGIMFIGISLLHANGLLTKLVDQVVIVLLNYFFSKFLIFKKR